MEYKNILYEGYKKDINTQYGEDGIIEFLLDKLNITSGVAVDVGAADGIWYSNTFELVKKGFTVYEIESDQTAKQSFKVLFENAKKYPNMIPYACFIDCDEGSEKHINKVLKNMGAPVDIELLSIDIDSIDHTVWEQINLNPKIVIMEIEPRYYPTDQKFHNPDGDRITNPPQNLTGFAPMNDLAKKKGYTLVAHTISNLIFLRDDIITELNMPEVTDNPLSNFNPHYLSKEDKVRWAEYEE